MLHCSQLSIFSQVDCLQQLCILGDQSVADNYDTQFSPRRSHQWWRFVTSIYLQHGIVDCLVITFLQIWLYWGQENSVGWLRMAIVHHTAGIGGHLVRRTTQGLILFSFKSFRTLAILVKMYTLRTGFDWNGLTVA